MARTKASWTATIDATAVDANTRHALVPIVLDQDPQREVVATVAPYQVERLIRQLQRAKRKLDGKGGAHRRAA